MHQSPELISRTCVTRNKQNRTGLIFSKLRLHQIKRKQTRTSQNIQYNSCDKLDNITIPARVSNPVVMSSRWPLLSDVLSDVMMPPKSMISTVVPAEFFSWYLEKMESSDEHELVRGAREHWSICMWRVPYRYMLFLQECQQHLLLANDRVVRCTYAHQQHQ